MKPQSLRLGFIATIVVLISSGKANAISYTFTNLGTLGGTSSYAWAINAAGQVAGFSYTAGNAAIHAARWDGTIATDLGTLGGNVSYARAINAAGQVAGYAYTADNAATHATRWDGPTATDLGTLGGTYSYANAINDAGQVAGGANTAGDGIGHATRWEGTTATDLGTLGGTYSSANAINAAGQVAGFSYTAGNAPHATRWDGTIATDLNSFLTASEISAGWVLTDATGINDSGSIVGIALNTNTGASTAYLLTASPSVAAVPEPETYAMLLAGLGVLGFVTRRRKIG